MNNLPLILLLIICSFSLNAQIDNSLDSIYYYNHTEQEIQLSRSDIVTNKNADGRVLELRIYDLNSTNQLSLNTITSFQWDDDFKTQEILWDCYPVVDTCIQTRITEFYTIGETSFTQSSLTNFSIYDDGNIFPDSLTLVSFRQSRDSIVFNAEGLLIKEIRLVSETPGLWAEDSAVEYFWDSTIPRVDSTHTFDENGMFEERTLWEYNSDGTLNFSLRVASDGRIISLHRQTYDEDGISTVKRSSSLSDTTYAEVRFDGLFRTNEWFILTSSGDTIPTSISEISYLDEERQFLDSIANYRWIDTLSQFAINNSRKYYYTNNMTSVEALSQISNYNIYPNPTSNFVMIQRETQDELLDSNYTLLNSNGVVIRKGMLNGKTTRVSLEEISANIYYLRIGLGAVYRLIVTN